MISPSATTVPTQDSTKTASERIWGAAYVVREYAERHAS